MNHLIDLVSRAPRHAGWLAVCSCVVAAIAFGSALDGYSHAQHPLAFLGARGFPHALAFNLLGFVVPGVLAAFVAMALRAGLPSNAGWPARIGARLLLLSALAFAAQGWLPLDPDDLDGPVSQWHAMAWTLWWIASGTGALLIAGGLLRQTKSLTPRSRTFASAALIAAVLIVVFALSPPALWPAGVAQRVAVGAWLALLILAGRNS